MRSIFISYRRDDSEGQSGRLYDDLMRRFGKNAVFMDVAGIRPGVDFRKEIDKSVTACGVLLAIIGPGWLDAKDEAGQRRLDNSFDFVRLETAAALKRDIPVVPVLVHGAKMPRSEQLPDDLKDLAYRNGVELTHPRWDSDVETLVKALQPYLDEPKSAAPNPAPKAGVEHKKYRRPILKWIIVLGAAIIGIVVYVQQQTGQQAEQNRQNVQSQQNRGSSKK